MNENGYSSQKPTDGTDAGPGGVQFRRAENRELEVYVCKGFSGEIVRAVVSLDWSLEEAVAGIADQIGYSSTDWEKIGLYNLSRDFEYRSGKRIRHTRTEQGDLVIMADGGACHKK